MLKRKGFKPKAAPRPPAPPRASSATPTEAQVSLPPSTAPTLPPSTAPTLPPSTPPPESTPTVPVVESQDVEPQTNASGSGDSPESAAQSTGVAETPTPATSNVAPAEAPLPPPTVQSEPEPRTDPDPKPAAPDVAPPHREIESLPTPAPTAPLAAEELSTSATRQPSTSSSTPGPTASLASEKPSTSTTSEPSNSTSIPDPAPVARRRGRRPAGVAVPIPPPGSGAAPLRTPTATPLVNGTQTAHPPTQPDSSAISTADGQNNTEPQPDIEGTDSPVAGPSRTSKRVPRPRKRKTNGNAAAAEGSGEGNSGDTAAPAPAPKRTRRRRANTENGETAPPPTKRVSRFSARESTPENSEQIKIDPNTVTMAELTKDTRTGKKFSMHERLEELERKKRRRANCRRRSQGGANGEEDDEVDGNGDGSTEGNQGSGSGASGANSNPAPVPVAAPGAGGASYQIVNGQLVFDTNSLQVNRHDDLGLNGGLVENTEDDFSRHVTSATYLRRNLRPSRWNDEDTEKFYHYLAMFGTDFETISHMFPGRTRAHIKNKFNREENTNKERVDAVVGGEKKVAIDIDEYVRVSGRELKPKEAIYAELKANEEELEAQQKAAEEERIEADRKRKEELFGKDGECSGNKRKKRKKEQV